MSLKRTVTYPIVRKKARYSKVPLKYGRARIYRSINNRNHQFSRTTECILSLNPSKGLGGNAGVKDLAFVFMFSSVNMYSHGVSTAYYDLPGYNEIAVLFDQYRIDKVDMEIYWTKNSSAAVAVTPVPMLHIANDYNDAITIFTNNTISEYANCRTIQLNTAGFNANGCIKHSCKPKQANMIFNQGISTAYSERTGFVDCTYGNVSHYGTKILYDSNGVTDDIDIGSLVIRFKYFITARNVR